MAAARQNVPRRSRSARIETLPDFTFGIRRRLDSLDSGWISFSGDYLIYAAAGVLTVEIEGKRWLLPPQRAAWVAAGAAVRISAETPVESSSILYAKTANLGLGFSCRVFSLNPMAREMIVYAMRWGAERSETTEDQERFFQSVALVCKELAERPEELWLPTVRSEFLQKAMGFILANLGSPLDIETVAGKVNVSGRTLARHFSSEANMTCGQFIHRARIIRAAELLAGSDATVLQVAGSVGYESASSFSEAFRGMMQETPRDFQKRTRGARAKGNT